MSQEDQNLNTDLVPEDGENPELQQDSSEDDGLGDDIAMLPEEKALLDSELADEEALDPEDPAPKPADVVPEDDVLGDIAEVQERMDSLDQHKDLLLDKYDDLAKQLDEGDIGQGAYDAAIRRLDLEMDQYKADHKTLADQYANKEQVIDQQSQKKAQEFQSVAVEFLSRPENSGLVEGSPAFIELQEQINRIASARPDLSYQEMLDRARVATAVMHDLPEATKTPVSKTAPKPKRQNAEIPPTLSNIPASESNTDDEFAGLDRLPAVQRDAAIAKMTPEQQERYLNG